MNGKSGVVADKNLRALFGEDIAITVRSVSVLNESKPYRSSDSGYVEFEQDIEMIYLVTDDLMDKPIEG